MGGVFKQGKSQKSQAEGAAYLCEQIRAKKLFAAGKLGTSELETLLFYVVDRVGDRSPYPPIIRKNITLNAGLFPATDASIDAWCVHMMEEVLPAMDAMVEWNRPVEEGLVLQRFSRDSERLVLRSLEPYYEAKKEQRYTYTPDTRFAIVSPFSKSINKQKERLTAVWTAEPLFHPTSSIVPVQAGYGPMLSDTGGWPAEITTWQQASSYVVEQVVATGASVALIGCGALSLPIAAALKKRGISAIHTGGATQILFGIKGRRWLTHSVIGPMMNGAWISPSVEEIPTRSERVEGGCYWT
jgi:hypothetical protein